MVLIMIACIGWVTNHFVSLRFPNQSDISAAVGCVICSFPTSCSLNVPCFMSQSLCGWVCVQHVWTVLQRKCICCHGMHPHHSLSAQANRNASDYWHTLSSSLWPGQWWLAEFCLRSDCRLFIVLSERVSNCVAANFGRSWVDGWTGNFACRCTSRAEPEEGRRSV